MSIIHDQPPSGGCENCGGVVRSRKIDGWLCSSCQREASLNN